MSHDSDLQLALVPSAPRSGWGPGDPGANIMAAIGTIFVLAGGAFGVAFLAGAVSMGRGDVLEALAGGAMMTLCFGGIGGLLAFFGWRKILRRRRAWKYGEAVQASVTRVGVNRMVKVNKRHPPQIEWTYRYGGQEFPGEASGFRASYATARTGQDIVVLVDRADPSQSVPWFSAG